MYKNKLVLTVMVAILLPYCFSLTQKEKRLLNKFDAQIVQLKLKLQILKKKLANKVSALNKDISKTNERINGDILSSVNKIKTSRAITINKCNDNFKSRTTKYKEQLKGKVEQFMDGYYNEQYKSTKSIVANAVYPFVKHLNLIGIEMRGKIGKFSIRFYK